MLAPSRHAKPFPGAPIHTLFLVEDDEDLGALTCQFLRESGFQTRLFLDANGVAEAVATAHPALLILDVNMPGESGLSLCRRIRATHPAQPILMLTSLAGEMDEAMGLEVGADDYVNKSVHPRILLLRIQSLLRRVQATQAILVVGDYRDAEFEMLLASRDVRIAGASLQLTTGEFDMLSLLVRRVGEPVSRDLMYQELRGIAYNGQDRTLDVRMSNLRKKLEDAGLPKRRIQSIRGVGYLFAPGASVTP